MKSPNVLISARGNNMEPISCSKQQTNARRDMYSFISSLVLLDVVRSNIALHKILNTELSNGSGE